MQNMYIVKGIVDLILKKNVCRYPTFFLSFVAFSQYSKPSEDPNISPESTAVQTAMAKNPNN